MHTLTLSFPTLTELAAAVAKLNGEVVRELPAPPAARVDAAPTAGKPKAEKTAASPATAAAASAPAPGASAPAASAHRAADAVDAVDYPTLQKAVFALAGKGPAGRTAAGELALSFGAKTFKELPADKWGAALAAVNAKIEEFALETVA